MQENVFGSNYAASYDSLYDDWGHDECYAAYRRLILDRGVTGDYGVLDVGCGTGIYMRKFMDDGHRVVGIDQSIGMLVAAAEKCPGAVLLSGDAGDYRVANADFGVVLMAGAVLGYMTTNDDVLASLASARKCLKPGGVLVFDVWNGAAVARSRPRDKVKAVKDEKGNDVIRVSSVVTDFVKHTTTVNYMLLAQVDGAIVKTNESHVMRYFFPQEIDLFLRLAGFKFSGCVAFPHLGYLSETDWHMGVAATAL